MLLLLLLLFMFLCVFYHLYSQSEHDEAVDKLNKMLNEVESGLSDAEHRKPVYDENDVVDLTTVMAQLDKQKVGYLIDPRVLAIGFKKTIKTSSVSDGTEMNIKVYFDLDTCFLGELRSLKLDKNRSL